jgi:hypothetical protein
MVTIYYLDKEGDKQVYINTIKAVLYDQACRIAEERAKRFDDYASLLTVSAIITY